MFQQIRCTDPLAVYRAQATLVRPYCAIFFRYGSPKHDTVLLAL